MDGVDSRVPESRRVARYTEAREVIEDHFAEGVGRIVWKYFATFQEAFERMHGKYLVPWLYWVGSAHDSAFGYERYMTFDFQRTILDEWMPSNEELEL